MSSSSKVGGAKAPQPPRLRRPCVGEVKLRNGYSYPWEAQVANIFCLGKREICGIKRFQQVPTTLFPAS